jgi:xylulokinase
MEHVPTSNRLVAGVDLSTQSTKVEIRDLATGAVVARGSAPHPGTVPPVSEQPPDAWWAAFEQAWAQAGAPAVAAISVAGQQHGMVALDVERAVLRPAKLWNDTESAPDAGWLWKQLPGGKAEWATAVGSVPLAAFTITKLSWLHRSEPETWQRLAHVLLPHDWLTMRLTGELVTDRGDASGTGYWSPSAGEYRWDLLSIVDAERDWTTVVPRVLGPLDVAGRWGGALVAPGTGDNMAAALGLAVGPGDAVVSLGTSGTSYTVSETPTADVSGAVAGFADATGRYLPLVCTLNAAKVLDAVRRLLRTDHDEFDRLALAGPSTGVTVLPYFDGERTPDLPGASGWIAGLRSDVEPEQLARATVEGVVCGMLDALDALDAQTERRAARVLLTGGAARSMAVRAVFASLCDRPVVVAEQSEAVVAGACVQAASVLDQCPAGDVAARWGLDAVVEVDRVDLGTSGVRERYAELRAQAYPA